MIPKSLHTVTALVNVARMIADTGNTPGGSAGAVRAAATVLGYPSGAPDPYGLLERAMVALGKERAAARAATGVQS